LSAWFNHTPALDLRVNQWRTDLATVQGALALAGIESTPIKEIPGALRLANHVGDITQLPGFGEGWWSVQDSSAQQVVQLLDPQPGERILDCCAAPGGKTTHIAEQLHNEGEVWALDRHAGRLRRVEANAQRLQLTCLQTRVVDLAVEDEDWAHRDLPAWGSVDRVLLDAPCSGLGTLHRHADARWQQSPQQIHSLVDLQARLLDRVARWVKPGGILVYSTCTLHPQENQAQIDAFLARTPGWQVDGSPIQIYPHRQDRDGFFMAKLLRC
jgi:16S rRNA (cytosine967-C5)-methyltransferase